jgi:2-polyprenyl-6-methoxyphenol hydroxylase-like FAD-dependent oxidoreductase
MVSEKPVPVLIIGAGVVGLSASLFLAQHGVKSIVIERRSGTSVHPRARSVNARTMELFRRLGITDHVREAGASIAPSVGIFQGSSLREVIEAIPRKEEGRKFPITGLMESVSPVSGTFVTQDMLEPVLVDETRRRRIKVQFSTECIDVQQDEGSVTATLKGHQSEDTFNIRADYLIAADGAKSPIRTQLKVPTTGRGPMGHLLNVLFHADLKDLVCNREFSLCMVERPDVVGLFTSINNSDRWVFHLSYDPSKAKRPNTTRRRNAKNSYASRLAYQISISISRASYLGSLQYVWQSAYNMDAFSWLAMRPTRCHRMQDKVRTLELQTRIILLGNWLPC